MAASRPKAFGFPQSERLRGKKNVEELFRRGSSLFLYPFLIKYREVNDTLHRVLISVPKKKISRATDRNRIKRRIREAYRLNKSCLYEQPTPRYHVAIVYQSEETLPQQEISDKLIILLGRLCGEKEST